MPTFDTVAAGAAPVAGYQPILEIGRGGMGTVWLARAVGAGGFERLVVVKRLNRELLGQEEAVKRFLDEARNAAFIHHANVVGIHQIGQDAEGYFLVLDYVEGGSLEDLVDRAALRRERIPPPIVLRIALDALAGLSAAHRAEDAAGRPLHLLHRDVSLQNLLVGRDGVARIADFGIAKSSLHSVSTDQKYIVGKLLYSPPEYLARKPVGPTLDVYALGVTLWIAFSGEEPWPDANEAQLVARICQDRIQRLSEAGVQIAPQVDALVARACDPDPERRYPTARDMADAIEAIGRETGWLASHAEVATFVETLMGVDLGRRRERIAEGIAAARLGSAATHRSSRPPGPVPRDAADERRPHRRSSATTAGIELPMTSRAGPAAAALVAIGLGVLGVVGYRVARTEPAEASSEGAANAASAPIGASAPAGAASSGTASTAGTGDLTTGSPSASGTLAVPAAVTSVPAPSVARAVANVRRDVGSDAPRRTEPSRMAPQPSAPQPSAPHREPAPALEPAEPGSKLPDGISKANPYRRPSPP